ncbi:Transcriptional regulatory protein FixJ [Brevundimonas sp. NIBR10]|uniref:response regulator transcription factor n=1 Tax=Brevundimonas sp. NIBR10 TaxID=3015997 RepID=UPI0022F1C4FF|nr:response regulator [Brevundimonas sp. NIBR10]WGM46169.1 Transcriptional regulatory protein FixJ [Brevundimonas sp. NIBR10]
MMTTSVFVIEDDFAVRDSLVTLLRAEGLRARGFASGVDFFDNLPADKIACVVTDLHMPGMDGTEVVKRIKALYGESWPIIVITGHGDISLAVDLMKAGVTDFIEKPFEPHRLIETLKGCLSRVHQVRADIDKRAVIEHRLAQLTVRERQVFDQLVEGLSNKEIAASLTISPRTVEIFRAKVMSKMEAPNLSALVRMSLGLS